METFYGHVNTLEQLFSYGPDGALVFKPWNTCYGTVHPDRGPGTGKDDVVFTLQDGEFFQVQEDIDMTEGRSGTKPAGISSTTLRPHRTVRLPAARGGIFRRLHPAPEALFLGKVRVLPCRLRRRGPARQRPWRQWPLLALTRGDSTASVAARTLAAISITRDGVFSLLTPGDGEAGNWHLPFTPQAKDVLDTAWHDAGNGQIIAEHFLLALAGRSDAAACQVLHAHDALIRHVPARN